MQPNLSNNVTYAILNSENTWRSDLTIRFTEYASRFINADDFIQNIIFVSTIDEALYSCKTDFLIVQSPGHIIFDVSFFSHLERLLDAEKDIVIGHVSLENDYISLEKRCIIFNIPAWKKFGEVSFTARVFDGPTYSIVSTSSKNHPAEINLKSDEMSDHIFVDRECSQLGVGILIKQLTTTGKIKTLKLLPENVHFYLDNGSPYLEIHNETLFEKRYLEVARQQVYTIDTDDLSNVRDIIVDTIICPAKGLKALNLIEIFGAKNVIIFSDNPKALEFQRFILSTPTSAIFGELVQQFMNAYPDTNFADDWELEEHCVVPALDPSITVSYQQVDIFSFEIEELIKSVKNSVTLLFDFSDLYVSPFNYYRRPLYQLQGLFAEVYSLLGSRTGPSFAIGYAPGFQLMNAIDINTSKNQYDIVLVSKYARLNQLLSNGDKNNEEEAKELIQLQQELTKPLLFKPDTSANKINDNVATSRQSSAYMMAGTIPMTIRC